MMSNPVVEAYGRPRGLQVDRDQIRLRMERRAVHRPDPTPRALEKDGDDLRPLGAATARLGDLLTPRELEVLQCVGAGRTNKGIAGDLAISEQTVKNHMSSILRKLGANDRTQAALMAMSTGQVAFPTAGDAVSKLVMHGLLRKMRAAGEQFLADVDRVEALLLEPEDVVELPAKGSPR